MLSRTQLPAGILLSIFVLIMSLAACQPIASEQPLSIPATAELASAPQEISEVNQQDALDHLKENASGEVIVNIRSDTDIPNFVRIKGAGDLLPGFENLSAEERGQVFFEENGGIFGIRNPASELNLVEQQTDFIGTTNLQYQQMYEGVEVFGGELQVRLNKDNQITSVNGTFITTRTPINPTPSLRIQAAVNIAVRAVEEQLQLDPNISDLSVVGTKLYIYQEGLLQGVDGPVHLVYEVEVVNSSRSVREFLYVDAHTGEIVDQITGILGLNRRIYDREFGDAFLVWKENDLPPNGDRDVENLIAFAEDTYNLFTTLTGGQFQSWDGQDGTMHSVNDAVSIGCTSGPNANWNGSTTNFCRDVTSDDIVAHEWSHAYSQSTHDLLYAYETGALNEAYSDIFGEIVDLLNHDGSDTPDAIRSKDACSIHGDGTPGIDNSFRWLVGEDSSAFGGAIRDMWNPTCYGHPGKVSDLEYHCGELDSRQFDNGGVHTNSGVPNHAFALVVDGGTYNGITVNGIGITKTAHIYWRAASIQVETTDFPAHAEALETACNELEQSGAELPSPKTDTVTPSDSGEIITVNDCAEVAKAINAVELRNEPSQCPLLLEPNAPLLCTNLGTTVSIFSSNWELGLGSWTKGTRDVANPSTFDTPQWDVVDTLPNNRTGKAAFVRNSNSRCQADNETGVLFLDSPEIIIPTNVKNPRMTFNHWVATEFGYDGGNIKIKLNGGNWILVPKSAFSFNGYNRRLVVSTKSTNPLAGEQAFTGKSAIDNGGNWGQSQINLLGLANPGDHIQLRFEFGLDECSGVWGWYIDEVDVYFCSAEMLCGNGLLDADETCDDGNNATGDGCSEQCFIEDGWTCMPPVLATEGTNMVADGSFEAGRFGGSWTETSTSFGSPVCSVSDCGGPAPVDGAYHLWFGGTVEAESASAQQQVVIPTTATSLDFDLFVKDCDSASDYMNVLIDGERIFTTAPCTPTSGYTPQSVNIASFANGQEHTLRFESEDFAINGSPSTFFVDNVWINDNQDEAGQPSMCTNVPDVGNSDASTLSNPNPLLYLSFDGDITDHSDTALVTSQTGNIEFVMGVHGQAAQFDGLGELVDVAGVASLPITDEMTLEFWVKMADWRNPYTGSAHLESVAHLGTFYGIGVWFDTWELEAHFTTEQTGDSFLSIRGGRLQPEQWHHIALVYRGKESKALLFLDGVQVAEQSVSGMIPPDNSNPFRVGTWYQQNQAFSGLVDELRLYNVSLAADLIQEHAQK